MNIASLRCDYTTDSRLRKLISGTAVIGRPSASSSFVIANAVGHVAIACDSVRVVSLLTAPIAAEYLKQADRVTVSTLTKSEALPVEYDDAE